MPQAPRARKLSVTVALDIQHHVSLAPFTSLELGGAAEQFAIITTREQLLEALHWAKDHELPVTVLGGGSNVIVSDQGVPGLTLLLATRGVSLEAAQGLISAEAGEDWDALVARCVEAQLSGIECLSGIPGKVGAAPIQNIGAYGQELSQCVRGVEVLDLLTLTTHTLAPEACAFAYRQSRWKRVPGLEIVLSLQLQLTPGAQPSLRYPELARALGGREPSAQSVRESVLELRRGKSMLLEPGSSDPNRRSVGSFFLNPVVSTSEAARVCEVAMQHGLIKHESELPQYPQSDSLLKLSAAWLIERSGTRKGERRGAVGISSRHCLALVHHGGGTARELLALAEEVRERVRRTFAVELELEPVLLGR